MSLQMQTGLESMVLMNGWHRITSKVPSGNAVFLSVELLKKQMLTTSGPQMELRSSPIRLITIYDPLFCMLPCIN